MSGVEPCPGLAGSLPRANPSRENKHRAVPGKILWVEEREGSRIARVQYDGIMRLTYLDFVPEAVVGDYVMVRAGFAISRVNVEKGVRSH